MWMWIVDCGCGRLGLVLLLLVDGRLTLLLILAGKSPRT